MVHTANLSRSIDYCNTVKNIEYNLSKLRQRIVTAARQYDRDPHHIKLIAVSKRQPEQAIRAAYSAGLIEFGENYLQEAVGKITVLADLDLRWHFIGPLQSNKTRPVAQHFAWIHSVDREKVARRLSEQRPNSLPPLNACIQVNISGEASKAGIDPAGLVALADRIASLPGLTLRGLMALPAPRPDFTAQRLAFRVLRQALEELNQQGHDLDSLSMGTSVDMEAAIAEGATLIRIGTALFGPRPD